MVIRSLPIALIVIQLDETKQHNRECPEGGAAVADEGQGDADDGQQAGGHADVDEKVEGDDARDAITVVADKRITLFFRQFENAEDEGAEEAEDDQGAEETPFFANGAEDEVGALLGHEIEFRLRAFEVALAEKSARADGNFRLVEVEVGAQRVGGFAQNGVNALLLVRFETVLVKEVDGEYEHDTGHIDDDVASHFFLLRAV